MAQPYVHTTIFEKYIQIEFFHPAGNSLPSSLLSQLTQALEKAESQAANVILIKSAGDRTFCAGASFDELASIRNETEGLAFFSGFGNVINAIRKSSKIVIIRIQGKAVGGGVGLAAAGDYAIAGHYASIRLSELAVGIGPFVIGPAVERKVGNSNFGKLALTPDEWQTAAWAKEKGLFNEVFESIQQVDEYIIHLIDLWNSYNPEALKEIKKMLWQGTAHWDDLLKQRAAVSGKLVLSPYAQNAIAKFKTS